MFRSNRWIYITMTANMIMALLNILLNNWQARSKLVGNCSGNSQVSSSIRVKIPFVSGRHAFQGPQNTFYQYEYAFLLAQVKRVADSHR